MQKSKPSVDDQAAEIIWRELPPVENYDRTTGWPTGSTKYDRHRAREMVKELRQLGWLHISDPPADDRPSSLQRETYRQCLDSGWDPTDQNTFAEEIAHLHEEISEAFREWRLHKDAEVRFAADGKPLGVPAEFADVVIGLLYNAQRMGFDLMAAVEQKQAYNRTRNYTAEGRQLHGENTELDEGRI